MAARKRCEPNACYCARCRRMSSMSGSARILNVSKRRFHCSIPAIGNTLCAGIHRRVVHTRPESRRAAAIHLHTPRWRAVSLQGALGMRLFAWLLLAAAAPAVAQNVVFVNSNVEGSGCTLAHAITPANFANAVVPGSIGSAAGDIGGCQTTPPCVGLFPLSGPVPADRPDSADHADVDRQLLVFRAEALTNGEVNETTTKD